MKKPHKHAELIKAWADGDEIQYRYMPCQLINAEIVWRDVEGLPVWCINTEYRIKPKQMPDVVMLYWITPTSFCFRGSSLSAANLRLTFCGETGRMKSAKVLET